MKRLVFHALGETIHVMFFGTISPVSRPLSNNYNVTHIGEGTKRGLFSRTNPTVCPCRGWTIGKMFIRTILDLSSTTALYKCETIVGMFRKDESVGVSRSGRDEIWYVQSNVNPCISPSLRRSVSLVPNWVILALTFGEGTQRQMSSGMNVRVCPRRGGRMVSCFRKRIDECPARQLFTSVRRTRQCRA